MCVVKEVARSTADGRNEGNGRALDGLLGRFWFPPKEKSIIYIVVRKKERKFWLKRNEYPSYLWPAARPFSTVRLVAEPI